MNAVHVDFEKCIFELMFKTNMTKKFNKKYSEHPRYLDLGCF